MSLQDYYNEFRRAPWADPDPKRCLCRGSGYALSDVDTWHTCPYHFKPGQRHPEDEHCPECHDIDPAHCTLCNPPPTPQELEGMEVAPVKEPEQPISDSEIPF